MVTLEPDPPSLPVEDDALRAVIEFNLKVLLEDLADNRMCYKPNLCVFWLGDDWVFGPYQCAFGREDDSSTRRINDEDLPGKSERRCQLMKSVYAHGT